MWMQSCFRQTFCILPVNQETPINFHTDGYVQLQEKKSKNGFIVHKMIKKSLWSSLLHIVQHFIVLITFFFLNSALFSQYNIKY